MHVYVKRDTLDASTSFESLPDGGFLEGDPVLELIAADTAHARLTAHLAHTFM
jgi:hypothetical protein